MALIPLIIHIDYSVSSTVHTVLETFQRQGKKILFAKATSHLLDIDTPQKDSYELFEAGLDFAMLVTDKQRYLKSKYDVSGYLPIPSDVDWIIQENEIYPTDIHLTVTTNHLLNENGEAFPFNNLSTLITWLEIYHERKNNTI